MRNSFAHCANILERRLSQRRVVFFSRRVSKGPSVQGLFHAFVLK